MRIVSVTSAAASAAGVYLLSIEEPSDGTDWIRGHSANNGDVFALGHGQIHGSG